MKDQKKVKKDKRKAKKAKKKAKKLMKKLKKKAKKIKQQIKKQVGRADMKAVRKAVKKMNKKAVKKAIKAVKKVKTWHQSRKFKKSSFRPAFRKTHKEITKIFKGIEIVKLPKQATVHAKAASPNGAMNGKLTAA